MIRCVMRAVREPSGPAGSCPIIILVSLEEAPDQSLANHRPDQTPLTQASASCPLKSRAVTPAASVAPHDLRNVPNSAFSPLTNSVRLISTQQLSPRALVRFCHVAVTFKRKTALQRHRSQHPRAVTLLCPGVKPRSALVTRILMTFRPWTLPVRNSQN